MSAGIIIGLIAIGGLVLYSIFRKPAAAGGDNIFVDARSNTPGTADSLTTGAQSEADPGLSVGSGVFNEGLAARSTVGAEGLATGERLPAGLLTDPLAINAAAAPLGLVFVADQKNLVTGGNQRVFDLASPVKDPVNNIGGFTFGNSFIERLPTGAASGAANVIQLGAPVGHVGGGSSAGPLKEGTPEHDAAAAHYRAQILQMREAASAPAAPAKTDSTTKPAGSQSAAAASSTGTTKSSAPPSPLGFSVPSTKKTTTTAGGGKSSGKGAGR